MASEKVWVAGDFNDHVGSDMGGFGKFHGLYWDWANLGSW